MCMQQHNLRQQVHTWGAKERVAHMPVLHLVGPCCLLTELGLYWYGVVQVLHWYCANCTSSCIAFGMAHQY